MPLYTWVDQETCIACGVCGATAPSIFDYNDEGIAFAKRDNNQGSTPIKKEEEEDLLDAKEGCPTESIKVMENTNNR
ncbi:ferredoxin [Gracilibacillus dipsosauri]|uniref:Ferredoxin n=1 Tax=Gracilibacillus dipsosauri TaxID=178340 RepID=A0A317KYW9_9BACI|nr:ferredoxin [Gracilibacillus dipsosauri]PWU68615.1 ferredoxin [Gracilibacillus dipsosauri]